jgi:hypothetical protein
MHIEHRGDLCCATYECHDVNGVWSWTAMLVAVHLRRACRHIISRILPSRYNCSIHSFTLPMYYREPVDLFPSFSCNLFPPVYLRVDNIHVISWDVTFSPGGNTSNNNGNFPQPAALPLARSFRFQLQDNL